MLSGLFCGKGYAVRIQRLAYAYKIRNKKKKINTTEIKPKETKL